MKVAINVKDRVEGNAIKAALGDPVTRAATVIVGHLMGLPTDRSRARVLAFVRDTLDEEKELAAKPTNGEE